MALSSDGGSAPRWRAVGEELYYVSRDDMLMAVPLGAGQTLQIGTPTPLFEVAMFTGFWFYGGAAN